PVLPIEIAAQPEGEVASEAEPEASQAESNTVRILADAKTTAPPREEPPAEPQVPPPDEASFRVGWRRWTGIIEYIVRGKGTASSINLEGFKALHKQLSRGISTLIASSEGDRRDFFRGLEFLVRPWMTPEILAKTDPDLLFDLFE